jgi:mono/diheme cytochrome c family protein
MKAHRLAKLAAGTGLMLGAVIIVAAPNASRSVQAGDWRYNEDQERIRIGFQIAPVPLNLKGKDSDLVGLGSYWVNAVSDCNSCHTSGGPPNFNFADGGNPYFGQPKKTDPTTYLAGGTDFGPAVPPVAGVYPPAGYGEYVGPDIITRNLTPDKTGRAEGGRTLAQFIEILRTGHDLDHIHPTCKSASDPNVAAGVCIPPPVDGNLLQIMPWPNFQDMSDQDLRAIYEYLGAIPCIDNTTSPPPAGAPNELRNHC